MRTLIAMTTLLVLGSTGLAHADFCREFTSTITVGNRFQEGIGTACLNPDGSWQIVSGPGAGTSFYDNSQPINQPVNYVTTSNTYYVPQSTVRYVVHDYPVTYVQPRPVIINRGPGWARRPYNSRPINISFNDRGGRYDRHDHDHGHGNGPGRWGR